MKSIWKGSISFGLVSIPVQLFTAQERKLLNFHLFHDSCLTQLKYHLWCPKCHKEVSWNNMIKGIQKPDGSNLMLTPEVIKELHPKRTEEITIIEFVDANQIPIIYLNHHYYVAPSKKETTAYALFTKALEKLGKVAIGRFVMKDKEYMCVLQFNNGYLMLTTLHYSYEVRGLESLSFKEKIKIKPSELKLAQEIVQKLSVKKFDITKFKDSFAQEIKKMLKEKTNKGKKSARVVIKRRAKTPSLVESLRESIKTIRHPAVYAKK